ncbi:MAG: MFS transporter [Arenicellales bacterium]|nr:MFS transporter [Arenicellales bacterium]
MTKDKGIRLRGIIACIAATSTMTVTLGLTWPLLAIVLERQGVPVWLNGLSASTQMLAILAVAPLGPRLIGWLGTVRVMALGIVGMAAALLLLPVFPNVWAWFPIRFLLGLAAELVFTGGDIWINQLARDSTRGRLIGIYGTFLHAGFGVGPATIAIVGSDNWTALYLGVIVVALGLIPLVWSKGAAPPVEGKLRARIFHFLRIAPTLMIAALIFGLIDSTVLALLPVYGVQKGLGAEEAALLLTMFVFGSVSGQIPIGWLADHMDKRALLAWCVLVAMISIGALPFVIGNVAATWVTMVFMGLTAGSFYVIAMAMIGVRFKGADLVSINASFVFLWGLGDVIGPFIGGAAIDTFGPDGMPAVGVCVCTLFLALVLFRRRQDAISN